uniref:Uncharacterized protein n=1 Tax=Rhizophora mucronata TaxID=61149 RepID=A0A2P2QA26_RHIMU
MLGTPVRSPMELPSLSGPQHSFIAKELRTENKATT